MPFLLICGTPAVVYAPANLRYGASQLALPPMPSFLYLPPFRAYFYDSKGICQDLELENFFNAAERTDVGAKRLHPQSIGTNPLWAQYPISHFAVKP